MTEKLKNFKLIGCNHPVPVCAKLTSEQYSGLPKERHGEIFTMKCKKQEPKLMPEIVLLAEVSNGEVVSMACDNTACFFHKEYSAIDRFTLKG